MNKIDPSMKEKEEESDGEKGNIQVVCGFGVILAANGFIELVEMKGMPMPPLKMALAMLSSAQSEMLSNVVSEKVYESLVRSMKEYGVDGPGPEDEDPHATPPDGPPMLKVTRGEDLPN